MNTQAEGAVLGIQISESRRITSASKAADESRAPKVNFEEPERVKTSGRILSEKGFQYLRYGVHLADLIRSCPYGWDSQKRRVIFRDSRARRLWWAVHNAFYYGYIGFVCVRWVQYAFFLESAASHSSIGLFYIISAYNTPSSTHWSLLKFYGAHYDWLNDFLDFADELQEHHTYQLENWIDNWKTVRTFMFSFFMVYLLDIVSAFALPSAPFYVASLTPDPMDLTWLQLLPFVLFHVYIWTHQWPSIIFHFNTLITYLNGMKNALNCLRFGATSRPSKRELLSAPPNSLMVQKEVEFLWTQMYRIQVLNAHCNQIWSTGHAIMEIAMLVGIILAGYGTVRAEGARAFHQLAIMFCLTGVVIVLWGIMGQLYEVSVEVLDSWRPMKRNPLLRRVLWATKPVRMNIGQGLFFADRGIRLTLLSIIVENTSSLLLSTSNSSKRT